MPNVDWVIHKVINEIGSGGIVNAHTHGMERYGQVDFQLALPFTLEKTMLILNAICFEVQKGRLFAPGHYYGAEVFNVDFRLEEFQETGREVLRLILPDPQLRFPEHPLCEASYKYQTRKAFEI